MAFYSANLFEIRIMNLKFAKFQFFLTRILKELKVFRIKIV